MASLQERGQKFIAHAPSFEVFRGRLQICERAAIKLGLVLHADALFAQRDEQTYAVQYSVQAVPTLQGLPETYISRNASIGPDVTLLGHKLALDRSAHEIALHLVLRTDHAQPSDDVVLVHLVNESTHAVVLVADHKPRYGFYSFPMWSAGEIADDLHWIALPDNLPAGTYQIRVGLYDLASGTRRVIIDPRNDAAGNSLRLESFVWP